MQLNPFNKSYHLFRRAHSCQGRRTLYKDETKLEEAEQGIALLLGDQCTLYSSPWWFIFESQT